MKLTLSGDTPVYELGTWAWPPPILTVWMAPVGWLGSAVVSCWLVTGKETEVTAAVTLPWVVMGVVLIGSTMLCCCWPAWIWTLGCWWMIGGVLATAAGDAIEVATIGLGAAGMPGCWALMTAVNPVSLAGVPGADWVARINCVCCCCCGIEKKKKLVKSLQEIAYSPWFPRFSQN